VLMELGLEQGVATMVAFADGTVSLYFSGGGGIIGAFKPAAMPSLRSIWPGGTC
jgi:hypothetical protein